MLAFGGEPMVLPDNDYESRTTGRREFGGGLLLTLTEAALRPNLQRLADAVAKVRGSECSSGTR